MTARIANGGRAVKPRLITGYRSGTSSGDDGPAAAHQVAFSSDAPEAPLLPPVGVDPSYLAVVQRGMDYVVNQPGGTAYRARIVNPAFRMAGKTGTSQVKRITMAERARGLTKPQDMPWKDRDNALFIGFAPVDNPKYAIAVVLEHGIGGAAFAGPIARDILEFALKRNTSPPTMIPPGAPASTLQPAAKREDHI